MLRGRGLLGYYNEDDCKFGRALSNGLCLESEEVGFCDVKIETTFDGADRGAPDHLPLHSKKDCPFT